jgi:hypothetical protein
MRGQVMAGSPISPTPQWTLAGRISGSIRIVLTGESVIGDEARQGTLSLYVLVGEDVLLPPHPLKRDTALSKKDDILIRNDEDVVVGSDGCGVVVHRS